MREPREGLLIPSEIAGRWEVAPHGVELHAGDALDVKDSRDRWISGAVEYSHDVGAYRFTADVVVPSGKELEQPLLSDLATLGHLVRIP